MRIVLLLLAAAIFACSSQPRCAPGQTATCTCQEGGSGVQRCSFDGSYGSCDCNNAAERDFSGGIWGKIPTRDELRDLPSLATDAGRPDAPERSDAGKDSGEAAPPSSAFDVLVADGKEPLIAGFVAPQALVVVLASGARWFDRKGVELMHWDASRTLTAAAFDGHLLSLADGGVLTTLDLDAGMHELSKVQLLASCQSAILLDGDRFVCATVQDGNALHVYDVRAGTAVSQLPFFERAKLTFASVPGSRRFLVSGDNLSLFELTSDDQLSVIAQVVDTRFAAYAFASDGKHAITNVGELLSVAGADCPLAPTVMSSPTHCFEDKGSLHTLDSSQLFVALHTADSTLYGLANAALSGSDCSDCRLQRIDLDKPELSGVRPYVNAVGRVSEVRAFAFDSTSNSILFGYQDDGRYRVELLSLTSL